jgi:DNA polymerase
MYRLAWRTHNENHRLLEDAADVDVRNAMMMDSAVRRDLHKMHAFVRFRETVDEQGEATYVSWFEPEHEILRPGAKFFVRRFLNMSWTIATPDGAAVWNKTSLEFVEAPAIDARRTRDAHEDLWRTYYRSIFNVNRLNPVAMQREMPQKYWKNLPEAADIGILMREGKSHFDARSKESPPAREMGKAVRQALAQLPTDEEGPQSSRRCALWQRATQAVMGEGPDSADIMLVGEQPGDAEDLQGRPFIGPAGRVLDEAISQAGMLRAELYITNAVKHFKWEPRGKRRLHKRPDLREIAACHDWLASEIRRIRPRVIVALGATALRSLVGTSLSVESARGQDLRHESGALISATYHPSAILRADEHRRAELHSLLVKDLQAAQEKLPPMRDRFVPSR